jgi:hypothetical protein
MEQMDYNLLFRRFVGLPADATTFTKNRERLQEGDIFNRFMDRLLNHESVKPLLSDEHFSVDGTLIEAWASHKSFKPKDDQDGDGRNFHDKKRKNDTHQSATDPDSRLYRKAEGKESKLCYMCHAVMENCSKLAVAGLITHADGKAERVASLKMLKKIARKETSHHGGRRQGIRHPRPRRRSSRRRHYATRRTEHGPQWRLRHRRRNHAASGLRHVANLPQDDRMRLRLGQAARHDAQGEDQRPCQRRLRLHAQPHRLQPRPHPETAGRDGIKRHGNKKTPRYGVEKPSRPRKKSGNHSRERGITAENRVFQQTADHRHNFSGTRCSATQPFNVS